MRILFVALAIALATPSYAADKALILNDAEQDWLKQALDAATKSQGLAIAPITLHLLQKLNSAGVVTKHHDNPAKQEDSR